jgi:hypothetical protein
MTETLAVTQALAVGAVDPSLIGDVLTHLENQLESARRMLAVVQEQGAAIRERNVPEVVQLATSLQTEMHRRELIEADRLRLLDRASVQLGVGAADITMKTLTMLMDPQTAEFATARTQELRSILGVIQREHTTNRALMTQELAFLDHLLRLAGSAGGYATDGNQAAVRRPPVYDYEA